MKRALPIVGLAVGFALTGCGSYFDSEGLDVQMYEEEYDSSEWEVAQDEARAEQYYQDSMAERYEQEEPSWASGGATAWTCWYSPTMNEDWHDDALCGNGSEHHRPYLREWDDFVTEAELMESAGEYAAELNAG